MNVNPIKKFGLTKENYEDLYFDDDNIFEYAYDYYLQSGDMPYGTAKARTGDPHEWVFAQIEGELMCS